VVIVDRQLTDSELKALYQKFSLKEEAVPSTNGILGGKSLRYDNEPVRHKTLD